MNIFTLYKGKSKRTDAPVPTGPLSFWQNLSGLMQAILGTIWLLFTPVAIQMFGTLAVVNTQGVNRDFDILAMSIFAPFFWLWFIVAFSWLASLLGKIFPVVTTIRLLILALIVASGLALTSVWSWYAVILYVMVPSVSVLLIEIIKRLFK